MVEHGVHTEIVKLGMYFQIPAKKAGHVITGVSLGAPTAWCCTFHPQVGDQWSLTYLVLLPDGCWFAGIQCGAS